MANDKKSRQNGTLTFLKKRKAYLEQNKDKWNEELEIVEKALESLE